MKASKNTLESLEDMSKVETLGDVRRVIGQTLLALARKEVSAVDVCAMAKAADAIAHTLDTEVKLVRTAQELRKSGVSMGEIAQLGRTLIG